MSLNYISLNNSKILNTNIKIFSWKKTFTHIFCSISENVQVNQNPKVISRNDYVFPLKRQDNLRFFTFKNKFLNTTTMVSCLRFLKTTNSSNCGRVWITKLLQTVQLPNTLNHKAQWVKWIRSAQVFYLYVKSSRSKLRYFNFELSLKLKWYLARDFLRS